MLAGCSIQNTTMFSIRHANRMGALLFLWSFYPIFGQSNTTVYWQPAVAVNYKISETYSHNFSMLNRNYLYNEGNSQFNVRHIDLAHFSDVQITDRQRLAIGILYRFRNMFEEQENELRLTQQYNLQLKPYVVRFGHRVRAEQRITNSATVHRFRYRFGVDFPLQGEKLDVGETYFIGTIEPLLSIAKNTKPEYDSRLSLFFGWQMNENTKLQLGSEYRMEDFTNSRETVIFVLSSLIFSL